MSRFTCTCGLDRPGIYNCAWHGETIIEESK